MAERATVSFSRPQTGPFTLALYRQVLDQVLDGKVFTLTVSTGDDERIFFFTRGAILFLAVGTSGGEVLARKIVARRLLPKEQVDALVARANSDTPLLQDILREEQLLDGVQIASLAEETIEDHLLEVSLWEGSGTLYDLVPGNPPTRLYAKEVPAVRLSLGAAPLLTRVRTKVTDDVPKTIAPLGNVLRNRVKVADGATIQDPVSKHLGADQRAISEVLIQAQREGVPAWKTVQVIARLVSEKKLVLERVAERTKQEEIQQAERIEDAFQGFLNALLARTHLAAIYERANEKEKAAEQHRGIADEHFKRDAVNEGIASLRSVLRLIPSDLGAREVIVKALRGANRLAEAARESVDLARALLDQNLPGRARQAYELALKLVPKTVPVLWMLAGLLSLLGEKEEAIKRYEELAQIARDNGDQDGEFAAYQQVLELDPRHGKAREVVNRLSGYRDAFRRRVAAVSASFLVMVLIVTYGIYEMAALSAFKKARDQARIALDDQQFDIARSAINEFDRAWTFSRLVSAGESLLVAIDEEEKLFKAQRSIKEERLAKDLEAKEQLPAAAAQWRLAIADVAEGPRKQILAGALSSCETKIAKVNDDVETAHKLDLQGLTKQAYDVIASDLPHAPWLLDATDLRVPLLIDSIPKEARITLDGEPQEKSTPFVVKRSLGTLHVRLDGRSREPVEQDVKGLPAWPLVLVLPRKATWATKDVVASSEPLLLRDLVIVGGVDRTLAAVARDTGQLRWRVPLGIFGECDSAPVALESGIVIARARAGSVYGVSTGGATRWTVDLEPPPLDPLEAHPEQPLVAGPGVVVRVGGRALACLDAGGKTRWQVIAPGDVVGALAASGDLVYAAAERRLFAFNVASGEKAWTLDLPAAAVLGPTVGTKGIVSVPLEGGAIARVSPQGRLVKVLRDLFDGSTATIQGDPRWTFVGSQGGDLVAVDETGRVAFRAFTDQQRPVLWVRPLTYSILYGDSAMLYALDREGKEQWRHPIDAAAPATGDDRQVFQGSPALGLAAYER